MAEALKPTPAAAFAAFAELGEFNRSDSAVVKRLCDQGYASISRNTVAKWRREGDWLGHLARGTIVESANQLAVINQALAVVDPSELSAERLEDTFQSTARVIETINTIVLGAASNVHIQSVEDLRTLVMIATNTAESMAKVHKVLGEAGAGPVHAIEQTTTQRVQGPGLVGLLSDFRKLRDGTEIE